MSDLTALIGGPGQTVEAWRESEYSARARLGLSEAGHKCNRFLWYAHHAAPQIPPDGRVLRLFRLGELIEDQAISDLRDAGFILHSQQKEVKIEDGDITLLGHIDGIIEGLKESAKPHLLECKSANEKSFKALRKSGYEAWNEKYKAQIHIYMTLLKLDRCLVWVENKNDSSIYTERINVNKDFAVKTLERVFKSIRQDDPPERSCPSMSWYEAKWCRYREVCFK